MPRGLNSDGSPNRGWFRKGQSQVRTEEHRRKIGEAQKRSWQKPERRLPLGSTKIDRDGYVRVKVVEGSGYWIPEHILIAERALGRELTADELVHHIDVVRHHNEPSNLHVYANVAAHNEGHRTLNDLVEGLLADGLIYFDRLTGAYKRCR